MVLFFPKTSSLGCEKGAFSQAILASIRSGRLAKQTAFLAVQDVSKLLRSGSRFD